MYNPITQTAFVTGSTKGIGKEILIYLESELKYKVISHSSKAKDAAVNRRNKHIVCDFTKPERIFEIIDSLQEVEVLINNASLFKNDDITSITFQYLYKHFMVDAFAPLMLTAKLPKLRNVINILDGRIIKNDDYFLSYTLAKKSLASITKTTAKSMASKGVRVNGIALGYLVRHHNQNIHLYKKLVSETPLGIETEPQELLNCIEMLLDCGSATGNIIHLDSGMHL